MKTFALLNVSDGFKYELGRFLFGVAFLAAIVVGFVICSLLTSWLKNRKGRKP